MTRQRFTAIATIVLFVVSIWAGATRAYAGGTVGNGTAASCTEAALTTALSGGGTVTFNCGAAPVTINLTATITISTTTTVDGGTEGKITLNGQGQISTVFYVNNNASFTLKNMVVRGGTSGGIYAESSTTLTVINVISRNNGVTGIRADGPVTIKNSEFSYNTQDGLQTFGPGASIDGLTTSNNGRNGVDISYSTQPVTINQLTADHNGTSGLVLWQLGNSATITNSALTNNQGANASGGGIYVNSSTDVYVTNTSFLGNSVSGYGGALYKYAPGVLSITNSTFSNNTAANGGGAIFAGAMVTLTVTGSTFTGNTAPMVNTSGGAILLTKPTSATISTSTFTNNQAHDYGGAVYAFLDYSQTLSFSGNTFTGNVAQTADGGAIHVEGFSPFSVQGSTFQGNQAATIGGAITAWVSATVSNSTFSGNNAVSGAAFSLVPNFSSPVGTLINNTITGNTATLNTNNGGAIDNHYNLSGTLTLQNTVVSSNLGGNCSTATLNSTPGLITDNGNNIQYGDTSCGATIPVSNPQLGTLADNGGPTQTIAPNAASPLINAGSNTGCSAAPVSGVDQRGLPRTWTGNTTCDIGAYETPTTYTACTLAELDGAIAAGGDYYFNCTSPTSITIPTTRTLATNIQLASNGILTLRASAVPTTMLQVSNPVTYASLRNLTIDFYSAGGGGADSALTNSSTGTVDVTGVTFTRPASNFNGYGIYQNAGTVRIRGSSFGNLPSGNGPGTGIYITGGTTSVSGSTFYKSAIYMIASVAKLSVTDSTFTVLASNYAIQLNTTQPVTLNRISISGSGGNGLSVASGTPATLLSSTINIDYTLALSAGDSNLRIYNSTIVNTNAIGTALSISASTTQAQIVNSTIVSPYRIYTGSNPLYAKNSLFYATGSGTTCTSSVVVDLGNNLQYPGTACSSTIPSADPKLGPLQNNGGPALTLLPYAGSPLIDAGDNDTCAAGPINNLDQRGFPRPLDGDGNTTQICDIGAVEAPTIPTIVKSFSPPSSSQIVLNGTSTLKFTLANLNSATNFTNVAFTDLLAPNVVVAGTPSVTNTCSTPGTVVAIPGSSTVTITGAGIAQNSTCAITVNVTSARAGQYANTASAISSLETGTGSTSNTVTLTVLNYPTIRNTFNAPSVGVNNPVTLTYTLTNPNAVTPLTGVGFVNVLPTNIKIAPTPNAASTCSPSGFIAEGAGATTVTFSNGGIPANTSCTVSIDVVASATGTYNNTTGAVTSTETGAGAASNTASLLALNAPAIVASAAPSTVDAGSETTLTYQITNPNSGVSLSNLSFTHVLPSGVTLATTPIISTTCPNKGTVTPSAGTTVTVAGFGLGKGVTCAIAVTIKGVTAGTYNTLAPATVTTTETGTGGSITPASLTVNSRPSIVNLSLSAATIGTGATANLVFTVNNTTGSPLSNVALNTTLPAGLIIGDSAFTDNCPTIGIVTAPPRGSAIAIAGVGLPASSACTIKVPVIGAAVGDYNFSTGAVSSAQTGSGAASNRVNLLVLDYPQLKLAFSPIITGLNQPTALTFTLTNPNQSRPLSAVAFSQTLPANLVIAAVPNVTNKCSTAGTVSAPANGSAISLTGAGLNPSEYCTITLNVRSGTTAAYNSTTGAVTSAETGTGAVSNTATLTVSSYPTVTIGFAPTTFKVGSTTTLTYTLNNPNAIPLTNVTFKHVLPGGLQIATSPSVTNNCATAGTVTAPASGTTISVSGVGMNASQTCVITVNITSGVAGLYATQTDPIQANETGIGGKSNTAQVNVALYSCDAPGVDAAINNGGPATFACIAPTTVNLTTTKDVTKNTILDGGGLLVLNPVIPAPPPIQGAGPKARDGRVYGAVIVDAGVTLRISGVTITNNANATITGLMVHGTAIITNVTFQNNTNTGALMIKDGAQVTVLNSAFINNQANTDGAAIYVETSPASTLTVINSTFSGNSTLGSGGAIYVEAGSTATIINSTFSGNSATVTGGAIYYQGGVTLTNTIVANSPLGGNCAGTGTLTNGGANLQYPGTTCGTTIPVADPQLSAIAANGGRTQTMAIAATSPAVNAGDYTTCNTPPVLNLDQRGYLRQIATACDIGAYERGAIPPTLNVTMPTRVTVGVPFDVTVTAVNPTANTVIGYRGVVAFSSSDGAASVPEDYTYNDLDSGARTFSVILNTPGTQTFTALDTANNTPPVTGTATTTVLVPPSAALDFVAANVQPGRPATMRFTITNANSSTALSGIALQVVLPTGLTLSTEPRLGATCSSTAPSAVPTGATIAVAGVTVSAGQACVVTVDVTAATPGTYPVQIVQVSSRETAPGARSNIAVLTVTSPGPTVSAGFAPSSIRVNNPSSLVFTLWNPTSAAFTGVQFSASVPSQILVSSPVSITNTCSTPGSVTTTSGVQVSGVGLAAGERCAISIAVSSLSAGAWPLQTGPVSTTQSGSGAPSNSATLTVTVTKIDTIGIYRPSNNTFYLKLTNSTGPADLSVKFGSSPNHYPIVGDWDGDGVDTVGYYDRGEGRFYLRNSNTPGPADLTALLGNPSDYPIAGRWTPDMTHDGIGVLRPSNGILYLKKTIDNGYSDYFAILGNPGDIGIAGDWDGNGYDSPGIYRPAESRYYVTNNSTPAGITFSDNGFVFGVANLDAPVVGDWIGQGHAGVGVFRVSNGVIYLRNTLNLGYSDLNFVYGIANDIPLAGHWVAGPVPPPAVLIVPGTAPISPTKVPGPSGGFD